jgi:MFS family permease
MPALLGLVFLVSLADAAFTPLLPGFEEDLALSEPQTGTLLAATMLVTLFLTVPIGVLVDRIGPRRVVTAGGVLLAVAAAGQAAADGFLAVLAARLLFGVAFSVAWTACPMVMLASAGPSGGMGRTIAAAGLGQLVGPGFAGVTADVAGPWLPFTVIAAGAVPLAFLLRHVSDARASDAVERGLRSTVLAMRREPRVVGAVLVVALLGFASSVTNLVVPLQLRDHGLSATEIGLLLTAAAVIWVLTAPVAGRVREHRVGTVLVGLSTAVMGAIWLLPIGSLSVLAIAAFLVLSSACRAPLNTFVYVFGRRAATGTGVAPGSYVGVMNVAWAVAAVAGPVMAGAALASGGPRWPYIIVAAPAVLVGAWITTLAPAGLRTPVTAR